MLMVNPICRIAILENVEGLASKMKGQEESEYKASQWWCQGVYSNVLFALDLPLS